MNKDPNGHMKLEVTIYYITGRQWGPIFVPHSWCEECDLTKRLVAKIVDELDIGDQVEVSAKPWLANMIPSLLKGGWHPPVLLINGRVHSQGIVPDAELLRDELSRQIHDRGISVT